MAQYRGSDAYAEIDNASLAVENATQAYRRGGSVDAVNKANARLADAHNRAYEIAGGVVRDDR